MNPRPTDRPDTEWLPTRQSLLSRLRQHDDHESWRTFFDRYWKLLYRLALQRGLTEQEAQEAVQETVIAVARTMPAFRYEPARCSFKSWLRHLAEKKIADQFRRRVRGARRLEVQADDPGMAEALENTADPASPALEHLWEREWEQHLIETALERVKQKVSASQFQIFHRHVVLGRPPREVAQTLEVSLMSVYLAKHRVGALVKEAVRQLEQELT